MPAWPAAPSPGELIRLPLALPPMLCDAAGYTGQARYIALHWTPFGDELVCSDGALSATGWWPAWTALCEHELGRAVLDSYQLGSSDTEATHWLLADRWRHTLDVGLELDVRQLLATQPSELAAAADAVGAERTLEVITRSLQRPKLPTPREIHARLERSNALVDDLRRWLDDQLRALKERGLASTGE